MPGPFTSYAPPGVYTRTLFEPAVAALVGGLRVPAFIGVGAENLTRLDLELIRGSSAVADTLVTLEDVTDRFIVSDVNPSNPTLGNHGGQLTRFKVRNFPIVTGDGQGTTSNDPLTVFCFIDGEPVPVSQVRGEVGEVIISSIPPANSEVRCTYFFNRMDTQITDDLSDQADGSNLVFKVFQTPIVTGQNGGITSTDPATVTVTVNDVEVEVTAVNGATGEVTLASAPANGTDVEATYFFNTFQDTFDYLPDQEIQSVNRAGVVPGRSDFTNTLDFVIDALTDGTQIIVWGASALASPGISTPGGTVFDDTQISATLFDDQIFLEEATAVVDTSVTPPVNSRREFTVANQITLGNGRNTTLGQDLFLTLSNGRTGVITDRPDLVTVYVGQDERDALSRPAVTVTQVDGSNRRITLQDPVPLNNKVFVNYYYNRIGDDSVTITNTLAGASGTGTYTLDSGVNGPLWGLAYDASGIAITKTGLPQILNWPIGSGEQFPDILLSGAGTPVAETVTVTFTDLPASAASLTSQNDTGFTVNTGVNDTFDFTISTLGAQSVTLTPSTEATTTGSVVGPFAASGLTFTVNVNGTGDQTFTFTGSNPLTAATLAGQINGSAVGFSASDSGGALALTTTAVGSSASIVIGNGSANGVLGFVTGAQVDGVDTPVATVVSDINTAVGDTIAGLSGSNLVLDTSLLAAPQTGTTATLVIGSGNANSTLGFESGQSDNGEDAQDGFTVASDNASGTGSGSTTTGLVGKTFTDDVTGLRFTVLAPAGGGRYTTGGSFDFEITRTLRANNAIPLKAIPGIEYRVDNTTGVALNDTATLRTFNGGGLEPAIGDLYYLTYDYRKTNFDPAVFTNFSDIEDNFGTLSPTNKLTLASFLAIQNGAVAVVLKQVLKAPGSEDATDQAYIEAIDELRKPVVGNVRPAIIAPLNTSNNVISFLSTHCNIQSSIRFRQERMGYYGYPVGTTPQAAQNIARNLRDRRMVGVYPDSAVVTLSDELGREVETVVDGSFLAAALAGSNVSPAFDVATPMTRRSLVGFTRLGRRLDAVEQNQTASAGLTVLEDLEPNVVVRQFLTTDMSSVLTREPTVTQIADFVQQAARASLDQFIGVKFLPAVLQDIETVLSQTLKALVQAEIIATYTGVSATVDDADPTVANVEAFYQPVFPLNYIVITFNLRSRL